MGRLDGKIALVTGAHGGIGAVVCEALSREGADVIGGDLEARQTVHGTEFASLDVTAERSVRSAVRHVLDTRGRIDVLVNMAAVIGPSKPPHEVSQAEFDATFAVNVRGTWLCTKYVIPAMVAQRGGSIINFSSVAGLVGGFALSTYHATKGAIRAMSKADAVTYAKDGIRVNSIYPGSIRTPMSDATEAVHPEGAAYRALLTDAHPLGRRGEPADIAYGVIYLASDESAFMTGSELVIDGGFTAR